MDNLNSSVPSVVPVYYTLITPPDLPLSGQGIKATAPFSINVQTRISREREHHFVHFFLASFLIESFHRAHVSEYVDTYVNTSATVGRFTAEEKDQLFIYPRAFFRGV